MTHLKIGDNAPHFEGIDQNGNKINLESLRGKKVILYFYPKDNTPGCTAEACNFRDHHLLLNEKGFVVIGISADSEVSHAGFAKKYELPFSLIADEEKKIILDYGVWGPKKFMGKTYNGINRTTFVISEEGIIEQIIEKVETKRPTEQLLKEMKIK